MSAEQEKKLPAPAEPAEAEDDDEEEDDAAAPAAPAEGGAAAADKKKKRKKKKKSAAAKAAAAAAAAADGSAPAAAAGSAAPQQAGATKGGKAKQTDPPSVPVASLFDVFPPGQRQDYTQEFNLKRTTDEEKRALERMHSDMYEDWRHGAEIHREVRKWARTWIRPGMAMTDIADRIEGAIRKISPAGGVSGGVAFPCGLSVNHIAAHWTPNPGDKTLLQAGDVLKVDIGVHVNGRIIDSAFTMAFDPKYDRLLEAVREATNAGVRACGIDARLADVGESVQEVMESYEVELGGRTLPVRPIRNLYGHSVGPYTIHAGKSVPIVRGGEGTRMEEGDCFAIETFGSTGRGFVQDGPDCSHYMRAPEAGSMPQSRVAGARQLLAHITKHHSTLAFARRWLDQAGLSKYQLSLKALVDCGAVNPYPPLLDERGSYVAQFEHTVCLKPTCKEVFTVGDDY